MNQPDANADRNADGPTDVSARGWFEVAKQTWKESGDDNLGLIASGVAFYAFLAIVPLLSAVVLSYGLIASAEQVAGHIAMLAQLMPADAADIIGSQLESMVETASSTVGFGLLLALGVALYGAMRGASAIITALNIVFNVEESRSFIRQSLVAIAITLGLVFIFIFASLGISALNFVETLLPDLGGVVHTLLQLGFWAAAAVTVSFVVAIIYRYAPNRPEAKWRWITPGSGIATLVWIAATLGFSFYISNFGNYNATYGSLGAVIVFLTWMYLSSYILLLGAELNQVLERRVGRKETLGQEGAAAADAQQPADSSSPKAAPEPKTPERQEHAPSLAPSLPSLVARLGAFSLLLTLLPRRRARA
jgi:membrane protein